MNHTRTFGLVATLALSLLAGCATRSPSGTSWDYRLITPTNATFEQQLNVAAKDGWEVVSASRDTGDTMMAVLRRPKR